MEGRLLPSAAETTHMLPSRDHSSAPEHAEELIEIQQECSRAVTKRKKPENVRNILEGLA